MPFLPIRAGRSILALILTVALAACADDPGLVGPNATLSPFKSASAAGDVILVTSASNGTETGSLRWALSQATGGEIIRFDSSLAGTTITLGQQIEIRQAVTIEGPADGGITLSGGDAVRVLDIALTGDEPVTLRNLSITNGLAPTGNSGGGIYATANVRLEHVTVADNQAAAAAAMFVNRELEVINSTITNNNSTMDYPVVYGNEGLTVVNSTVSHNRGTGLATSGSNNVLHNSIIALNEYNGQLWNCRGSLTFTYVGVNLSDDATCGDSTVMVIADPGLGDLADHGGPGLTRALEPASPALNAGTSCSVSVDQRYYPRDAQCDLGAYEFRDFTTVGLAIDASLTVNPNTGVAYVSGTATCSADETLDLAVELVQEQKAGRAPSVVRADAIVPVSCGATARPWVVALAPVSGAFSNGSAVATVRTSDAARWITPAETTQAVKLFWGHR
jgi:hypothetical protein